MKKLYLLLPLLVIPLASCHIKVRVDTFFSEKELKKFSLINLPVIESSEKAVKSYKDGMDCYFNAEEDYIKTYANKIYNYLSDNDFTYGANVPSTTFADVIGGIGGFSVYHFNDLSFYETRDFGYTFYYQVNKDAYMIDLFKEDNKSPGLSYPYRLHVHRYVDYVKEFLKEDDYSFLDLNEDIFYQNGSIDFYQFSADEAGSTNIGYKIELNCLISNLDMDIKAKYKGEDMTLNATFDKKKIFENKIELIKTFKINEEYQEGDLILQSISFKEGCKILIKNQSE